MEGLIAAGVEQNHPAIQRGVEYLKRTQEVDGSWYGRWGVDYIYGTFLALRGLQADAGERIDQQSDADRYREVAQPGGHDGSLLSCTDVTIAPAS